MAHRPPAPHTYATSVVRLFPGWADSVVWFPSPVAYADTHLDASLVADLVEWERSFYAGLGPDLSWPSPQLEADFLAVGARLARRLADQIGDEFQVQHDTAAGHRLVRAAGPARNREAEAAFRGFADEALGRWTELRDIVERAERDGHVLEWRAYPEDR